MKVVQDLESLGNRAFIFRIRLASFMSPSSRFKQLQSPRPAGFCVSGHQQILQLFVGVVASHVDVPEAVGDFDADLRGQGTEVVIKLGLRAGNSAD